MSCSVRTNYNLLHTDLGVRLYIYTRDVISNILQFYASFHFSDVLSSIFHMLQKASICLMRCWKVCWNLKCKRSRFFSHIHQTHFIYIPRAFPRSYINFSTSTLLCWRSFVDLLTNLIAKLSFSQSTKHIQRNFSLLDKWQSKWWKQIMVIQMKKRI